jgi:hypothetical protein
MTMVWGFQCKAFGNNIMNFAFHKRSLEIGSLSQVNLNMFKFLRLRISSPYMCVLNKNRMMDNVQKYKNYINIPSSQTFHLI